MRKEEYINEVISKIENNKARREVEKELSAHIDDRISYYTDAGWDEETANEKAVEQMGSPEKTASEFDKLYSKEPVQNVGMLFLYGIMLLFIWGCVNLLFFLITHGIAIPGFEGESMFGEKDMRISYILYLLVCSLINYIFVLLLYKYGKRFELRINPIAGLIVFLQPHIFVMILFYATSDSYMVSSLIDWWTATLYFAVGEKGLLSDLVDSVVCNMALTFIPYISFYLGMLRSRS